ncbi:MAG: M28 family peptidase, partial [Phycisphaeraceae bacterium]
ERMATAYLADVFRTIGLEPAGDDGTYFQEFEFTAGVSLGDDNALSIQHDGETTRYTVNEQWRPLAFARSGEVEPAPIVFAGYGIVAPAEEDMENYDSYVHLDVTDKWVMVLRYLPEDVTDAQRQHLNRYASLRYKAMAARDRGAKGIIFVSGPNSEVRHELVPLRFDASLSGTSLPVISIADEVAADWLNAAEKDLQELHDSLDTGEMMMGFELPGLKLDAAIEIVQQRRTGRNVLARLSATDDEAAGLVVLGAHIDHLGDGSASGSLAHDDEESTIHYGADDNASGIAAMIEVAHYLHARHADGELPAHRDVLFAAWSGEELGLLGSSHFVRHFTPPASAFVEGPPAGHPPVEGAHAEDEANHAQTLRPGIAAYLNMDMIGRYEQALTLQGVGSSEAWPGLIERANVPVGLRIQTQDDAYLPTDSTPFFVRGVPVLSAFTGAHAEYHTPRDTADLINFEDTQRITRFIGLLTRQLVLREQSPDYVAQRAPEQDEARAGLRAFLGTVPDYAGGDAEGMKLSGVSEGGPADEAGLQGGDVIIELAGKKIENIYDYTYAIEALKIGEETSIKVQRGEETLDLTITPASRE